MCIRDRGYSVKYVEFSDYVQPNNALADGEIDLNLFQHATYLETVSYTHLDGREREQRQQRQPVIGAERAQNAAYGQADHQEQTRAAQVHA